MRGWIASIGGCVALLLMTTRANATWSIVAAERSSRSFGHAIASCVSVPLDDGYGSVEGKGAMVTQANFHPPALTKGLELLTAGKTPAEAIAALTDSAFDAEYPTRQHGIVDLAGAPAAFTGVLASNAKGDRTGNDARFVWSVQGNLLVSDAVIAKTEAAFLAEGCDFADRLMRAVEAGAADGGDKRCTANGTTARSAFIQIDRAGEAKGAFLKLTAVVDEKTDAVASLRTQFNAWRTSHACASSLPDAGAPDALTPAADPPADDSGGCACTSVTTRSSNAGALPLLVLLGVLVRRRNLRSLIVSSSRDGTRVSCE